MHLLLLTGAGFSRNWGGWLANEAFEYLLGCDLLPSVRQKLWESYDIGAGFEGALGNLASFERPELLRALVRMFAAMNAGFGKVRSGPQFGDTAIGSLKDFLGRFDAIYTLNQDLLLEIQYGVPVSRPTRWSRWGTPGLSFADSSRTRPNDLMVPMPAADFKFPSDVQPYIKLHGSSNFVEEGGRPDSLLILGKDKEEGITRIELLRWYFEDFRRRLGEGARVVIIGYSFGDNHINQALARSHRDCRFFVVDPHGVDVLDKRKVALNGNRTPSRAAVETLSSLSFRLAGASRRSLDEIFGGDAVELDKLLNFCSR